MVDEVQGTDQTSTMPEEEAPGIVGYISSKYSEAKASRQTHEARWLRAYKNYRGVYDSTTQFRDNEKSKVFVKITKTKTLAAYGQIVDVLFANKKFPITVSSTPVPEGVADVAHLRVPGEENLESSVGFPGDGKEILPGATNATPLGGLQSEYEGADLAEGRARIPNQPEICCKCFKTCNI